MESSHAPGYGEVEAGKPHGLRPFDEARRDDTPSHRLREIVNRAATLKEFGERERIEEAVTENPNIPPDLLVQLAPKHWRAFFRNPAAPLLLLEAPDFLDRLTPAGRGSLLRLTGVPDWMLRFFAADTTDPMLALEARLHHGLTGEIGREWETRLRSVLKRVAGLTGPREQQAQAEMVELGLAPAWVAGPALAPLAEVDDLPNVGPMPPELQLPLLEARDRQTTAERLQELTTAQSDRFYDETLPFWIAVAQHPNTSPEELATVLRAWNSRRNGELVRQCIALHLNAGSGLIRLLLEDRDAAVRRAARKHPRAPKDSANLSRPAALREALRPLTLEQRGSLCRFVALLRPEVSETVIHRAADAPLWLDRLGAALRTRDSLATLANDGNALVRAAARARRTAGKTAFRFEL